MPRHQITACALVTVASVAAASWISWRVELRDLRLSAEQIASQIVKRNEHITDQVFGALASISGAHVGAPCSEADKDAMTRLALHSSYLQAVVRVEGNRITCGSLDLKGVDIGPVDFTARNGSKIRTSRKLPIDPSATYRITQSARSGHAVIVMTELAFDVLPDGERAFGALMSTETGLSISQLGDWDTSWLRPFQARGTQSFARGDAIIGVSRSDKYDYYAVASLPASALRPAWLSTLPVAVAFGLLVGAGLSFLTVLALRRNSSLRALMRQALRSRSELYLHYQPLVDLQTGSWVGAEALLRWRRPGGETISPALFIPMAEQEGMISDVTRKVLEILRRDLKTFLRERPGFFVTVNIAVSDLLDPGFARHLVETLEGWDIARDQIRLEVTEYSLIDVQAAKTGIDRLKALGFQIAIDDFGTGYSSLAVVADLNIDSIKIDKSFVEAIGIDSPRSQIADHIIQIGHTLRRKLVAEGIETAAQEEYLRARGVAYGQGWHFARAMALEELRDRYAQMGGEPPV